ncbi:LuxR C-terminal-related transcriptional regulator [Kitasatospora phosalacinea]|uniref:helix-turn-helix transcriptional regulator n=1 Tax=Kitasatospora phosalacinea TaxID=2065 RepID=UPI0035E2FBF6
MSAAALQALLASESTYWRSVLDLAGGRLDCLLTIQEQVSAAAAPGPAPGLDPSPPPDAVDTVDTVAAEALPALLRSLAAGCRSEVGWLCSDGPRPSPLAPLLGRGLAGLSSGVRVRALLDSAPAAARAGRLLAARPGSGAHEVRSSPGLPQEILLVDDRIALVPQTAPGDGPVVTVLRERAAVRLARLLFETAWSTAAPVAPAAAALAPELDPAPEPDPDALSDDPLKLQILQLLAGGAKDESIARRTGISLRTCRRHIAAILLALNAESRFQAGAHAFRLDLIGPSAHR